MIESRTDKLFKRYYKKRARRAVKKLYAKYLIREEIEIANELNRR